MEMFFSFILQEAVSNLHTIETVGADVDRITSAGMVQVCFPKKYRNGLICSEALYLPRQQCVSDVL